MRTIHRPKSIALREIYVAPFLRNETDYEGNVVRVYDKPFMIKASVSTITTSFEVQEYGDDWNKLLQLVLPFNEYINVIKERDNIYLFKKPLEDEVNGENANYFVYGVLPQNKIIRLYLKKYNV